MAKKPNSLLDITVIETWINETLRESEFLDVAGAMNRKQSGAHPLEDYAVDRFGLRNIGLSNA